MKKLLVTGISGFLGECIARLDQKEWKIFGVYNSNPVEYPEVETFKSDITNQDKIEILLDKIQPQAVIHLAANANPNYCETNVELTNPINIETPTHLATICKRRNIAYLFVSTDLVFDGNHAPYSENDTPQPISVYGKQKVIAEKAVLKENPKACVVRCPVMFGLPKNANSFMKSWLQNLKEGEVVYAFTDEYRTVVSGTTAVKGILLLLERKASGLWHLGGKERLSRYDFAVQMAKEFELSEELITPSLRANVQMPAARPADVSLNSSKAYKIGYQVETIQQQLQNLKKQNF